MARARDFAEEYRRRLARADARGFSKSQARGHARAGEAPIRSARVAAIPRGDPRLEAALKALRRTGTQRDAARIAGISPERFRRFLRENALAERVGKSWRITDLHPREMTVYTTEGAQTLMLPGLEPASLAGDHRAAVKTFRDSNDPSHLAPFVGRGVTDTLGRVHLLQTDPNALYELLVEREGYPEIYRLVA